MYTFSSIDVIYFTNPLISSFSVNNFSSNKDLNLSVYLKSNFFNNFDTVIFFLSSLLVLFFTSL